MDAGHEDANWQTRCGGLSSRLGALRAQGIWTDCEIIVGSSQEQLSAHRVLLGSSSPVLAAMLYGPLAQPDRAIHIPNIELDTFTRLLEFIYTDNIEMNSCDIGCSLYAAANFLDMPHVETVCKTYILNNVTKESVLRIYEFAKMFGEEEIKQKCLEIMSCNVNKVFKDEDLCSVSVEALEQLFGMSYLNCSSELELFTIAERWVRANTTPAEDDNASLDKENQEVGAGDAISTVKIFDNKTEDPKTSIRRALQHIRFLAINPEEFAKRDMTTLLEEREILAISLNMKTEKSYMPMPEGFCTLKELRFSDVITLKCTSKNTWKGQYRNGDLIWFIRLYYMPNSFVKVGVRIQDDVKKYQNEYSCDANLRVKILSNTNSWTCLIDELNNFNTYSETILSTGFSAQELLNSIKGYRKGADGYISLSVDISNISV